MRQRSFAGAVCVVAVLSTAAVSAQEPAPTPAQPPAAPADAAAFSMKAISRLFAPADVARGPRPKLFAPSVEPRQTCGMKVLRPDSTIDPKFERPPADTRTRFHIRTVPVPCR